MCDKRKFREVAKKVHPQSITRIIRKNSRDTWRITVSISKRLAKYKDQLGYYTALVIVLIALSVTAYDYRMKRTSAIEFDDSTKDMGIQVQSQPVPTFSPIYQEPEFVLPLQGEVVQDFSANELVWSTTLQLWQTHPAIDIAASLGEAVVSCADGKIIEAYNDALYGNTIVIDHGNDIIIRYKSLNTLELVEIDQSVARGDIISSVGTCNAEASLGSHLHLECIRNGENTDFFDLLSEKDNHNLQD